MRLSVVVDHRVAGVRPHDRAAHQMDRRHVAAGRPHILGARRLGDLEPLREIAVPHRLRILVVGMNDLGERHAELVFVADQLDAVLDVWQFLSERPDAAQPSLGAFHKRLQIGAEQVGAGIGDAAELVRLLGEPGDDERAAEAFLVARLAIAFVRHVLSARCAHVGFDILVENR